ncbi:MAG: sigma-70 family RNA polymerase sigma factor [bacterium]
MVNLRTVVERSLRDEGSASPLPAAVRAELLSLRGETDSALLAEALFSLATRQEQCDRMELAAQLYAELAAAAGSPLAERARARLDAMQGRGEAPARAEFLFRRFAREASDPAMLAAMTGAGVVFRVTRLAVLGRLAATPGANLLTRGFGARAVASLAGFALEAPAFTLTSRFANAALGRPQDWSLRGFGRELASSYLVLGGMKLAGFASEGLYQRVAGPIAGTRPSAAQLLSQSLFQQAGSLGGILLGHALETRAGLREPVDGATTLTDSLALLLQFHVAGRLTRAITGENFQTWERSLDLQTESLARLSRIPRFTMPGWDHGLALAPVLMMTGDPAEGLPGAEGSAPPPPPAGTVSGLRPAPPPRLAPESHEPSSMESALRRQLAESRQISEDEKRDLIARYQSGDRRAGEELLRADFRYVVQMAKRYGYSFGVGRQDVHDLIQEGSRGLLKAAERFDLERDNTFLTYASWWMRHHITRYLLDNHREIRIPLYRQDLLRRLSREVESLQKQGREFGDQDLAERMDMSAKAVEELQAERASGKLLQLETPLGEDGDFDLHDRIASHTPPPDEALVGSRLQALVRRFIATRRSETERRILELSLLEGEMDVKEIAETLGIKPSEARATRQRLLQRLKHFAAAAGLRPDGTGILSPGYLASTEKAEASGGAVVGARAEPVSEAPQSGESRPALRPRIAILGFGMAGVGAANALRNAGLFTRDPRDFRPQITVFEGMNRVGGKAAPDNLGAQFVDRTHFYPIDRLIAEHGLATTAPREDYDAAAFVTRSGVTISGHRFSRALRALRQAAREALRRRNWEELDRESAVDFIRRMGDDRGPLDSEEVEAMVSRLGFEEGTLNVSMLSFAINLAKSETPMERYEVVGGIRQIAEAEARAVETEGGRVLLGSPVRGIQVLRDGLKVFFDQAGKAQEEVFDYGILALAPEHLRRFEVMGSAMPIDAVGRLTPAHIVKSNLRSTLPMPEQERATARFAMWFTPDPLRPDRKPMVTFFHGWNGEPMLSPAEMVREAFGPGDPEAVVQFDSQIWDGRSQDGISHYYTTMPEPGRGLAMLRFAMDQYFEGRYDGERLKVANHVLGLGCYIRDAALSGEWAAISLMRGMGLDVRLDFQRNGRPERRFLGTERIK